MRVNCLTRVRKLQFRFLFNRLMQGSANSKILPPDSLGNTGNSSNYVAEDTPLLHHHLPVKSRSLYDSYVLQSKLRQCVNIKEMELVLTEFRELLLDEKVKIATVFLEFLNQFYIHPFQLSFDQDKVRSIYEFIDQINLQSYGVYELSLKLSIVNKIIVYYTGGQQKLIKRWKYLITKTQKQLLDAFSKKKQQTKKQLQSSDPSVRANAQKYRMDFIDAFNIMTSTSFLLNEQTVNLSLEFMNEIIREDFFEAGASNSKFLFIIVKKLGQVSWAKVRNYKNIMWCLVNARTPYDNFHKSYASLFINLCSLKLHLVGPKLIPPLLSKMLTTICKHLDFFPQKSLLQVLSCFEILPVGFQNDSMTKIFHFLRNNYITTHYLSYLPYTRLMKSEVEQVFNTLIKSETQKVWQDGVYYLNNWNAWSQIFQYRNFHQAVQKLYQDQLRHENFQTARDSVLYVIFAYGLETQGIYFKLTNHLANNTKLQFLRDKTPGYYSYSVIGIEIFSIFVEKMSSKYATNSIKAPQKYSFKGLITCLQNFSIRNWFVLFQMCKKAESFNPKEGDKYKYFYKKMCELLPETIARKSRRVIFNNFKKQVIETLIWFKSVKDFQIRKNLYMLICYYIVREEWRIRNQITSFGKQGSVSTKSFGNWEELGLLERGQKEMDQSQAQFEECGSFLMPQNALADYLDRIQAFPEFDFRIYPEILFALNDRPFGLKKVSPQDEFSVALSRILIKKIKTRQEEQTLVELFLLERNHTLQSVRNMLHLLLERRAHLRSIIQLITGLNKYQGQSIRKYRGTPIFQFLQLLHYYTENQNLIREQIAGGPSSQLTTMDTLDIISADKFLHLLVELKNNLTAIRFAKTFARIYLETFPLEQVFDQQSGTEHNQIARYQHSYSFLQIASQLITVRTENIEQNVQAQQQSSLNQPVQREQSQETNQTEENPLQKQQLPTKYSLKVDALSQPTRHASKQAEEQSKMIISLLKKLRSSLNSDSFQYYALSPPTHELLILANLTTVLKIPLDLRQNLANEIFMNIDELSMKRRSPPQEKLIAIWKLFNNLVLLRLYCSGKVDLQDHRLQVIRLISELDRGNHSSSEPTENFQARLDLRMIQKALSHFPLIFIREITKTYNYKGVEERISNIEKFNKLLMPIIEQTVRNSVATLSLLPSAMYIMNLMCQLTKIMFFRNQLRQSFFDSAAKVVQSVLIFQVLIIKKFLFSQLLEAIQAIEQFRIYDRKPKNVLQSLRQKLQSQQKQYDFQEKTIQIARLWCISEIDITRQINPKEKKWVSNYVKLYQTHLEYLQKRIAFNSNANQISIPSSYSYIWTQFYLHSSVSSLSLDYKALIQILPFRKVLKQFLTYFKNLFDEVRIPSIFKSDWQTKKCLIDCYDLTHLLLLKFAQNPNEEHAISQKACSDLQEIKQLKQSIDSDKPLLKAIQFFKKKFSHTQLTENFHLLLQRSKKISPFTGVDFLKYNNLYQLDQKTILFPLKKYHSNSSQTHFTGQLKMDLLVAKAIIEAQAPESSRKNFRILILNPRLSNPQSSDPVKLIPLNQFLAKALENLQSERRQQHDKNDK